MRLITRKNTEPLEDYGFFGPDSVTWKVWSHPTGFGLGFIRATTVEELDPHLIAAVVDSGGVYARPARRYDRTLHYFELVKFGDSRTATKASNVLVKLHAKAVGLDPVSGRNYDANDPDSQLWIHMTAWHSILKCYEVYGPGKLSEAEENRYWEECAVAAELQTIRTEDVPRTREAVRAYFDSCKPKLAGSVEAQKMMKFLLNGLDYVLPTPPRPLAPLHRALVKTHRAAVIATMPRWMRSLAGIKQGRITDALLILPMKLLYATLNAIRPAFPTLVTSVAPSTAEVAAPLYLKIPPKNPRTFTPAEARDTDGVLAPREEYARFRALIEQRRAAGAQTEAELGIGPEVPESLELIGPTA
jgi:uncharacterized protein (DUF2236 family)